MLLCSPLGSRCIHELRSYRALRPNRHPRTDRPWDGEAALRDTPGQFNFDQDNPPISPITGNPVRTWYKPGETLNTVFGKLAPTVEECRAYLVADYLADNRDILAMFGYDDNGTPTADDCKCHT